MEKNPWAQGLSNLGPCCCDAKVLISTLDFNRAGINKDGKNWIKQNDQNT